MVCEEFQSQLFIDREINKTETNFLSLWIVWLQSVKKQCTWQLKINNINILPHNLF